MAVMGRERLCCHRRHTGRKADGRRCGVAAARVLESSHSASFLGDSRAQSGLPLWPFLCAAHSYDWPSIWLAMIAMAR